MQVSIAGTAMSASNVPFRVDTARRSNGQTEVHRILDWREPPTAIRLHSESVTPNIEGGDPGEEVREIAKITTWFDERGVLLVFSGRGIGIGPADASSWKHTANLIDPKADALLGRFEAPSRIEAARHARRWWQENRESNVIVTPPPPTAVAEAPAPEVNLEQVDRLRRSGIQLIWTAPTPEDRDSMWMVEAYGDAGQLPAIGLGETAEDALLTILEDLLPPDEGDEP